MILIFEIIEALCVWKLSLMVWCIGANKSLSCHSNIQRIKQTFLNRFKIKVLPSFALDNPPIMIYVMVKLGIKHDLLTKV